MKKKLNMIQNAVRKIILIFGKIWLKYIKTVLRFLMKESLNMIHKRKKANSKI